MVLKRKYVVSTLLLIVVLASSIGFAMADYNRLIFRINIRGPSYFTFRGPSSLPYYTQWSNESTLAVIGKTDLERFDGDPIICHYRFIAPSKIMGALRIDWTYEETIHKLQVVLKCEAVERGFYYTRQGEPDLLFVYPIEFAGTYTVDDVKHEISGQAQLSAPGLTLFKQFRLVLWTSDSSSGLASIWLHWIEYLEPAPTVFKYMFRGL